MANIVWLPISDKLTLMHSEEMQILHVMVSGVQAVQVGEMPIVIRSRLISALPLTRQMQLANERYKFREEKREDDIKKAENTPNNVFVAPEVKINIKP
jgi:flagellar motor component MotA